MPSAIIDQWSEKNILDLLSFSQTLPKDETEVGSNQRFWGGMHHGGMMHRGMMHRGMMHRDYELSSGRGFGPSIE